MFEDRAIKAGVTAKAEKQIAASAVFASNTSTLPITGLAKASERPENFIGLHFFSPVDKMPLVEIIVGKETSDDTLAKGFDYVLQIGKTPIVVNDSRGFYTSRVFGTYVTEGIAMLKEGVHPRSIEVAGLQAGMPMPPLALQDEVSLSLSLHVQEQTRKDLAAEGKTYPEHPGASVIRQMCEIGRIGKKAGKGFYDWGQAPTARARACGRSSPRCTPPARAARAAGADRPPDVRPGQRGRALLRREACCARWPTATSARSSAGASRRSRAARCSSSTRMGPRSLWSGRASWRRSTGRGSSRRGWW